jgi:asparagine synthase (glutamine-hydrolysing)
MAFARSWFTRPGAATPVDRALRLDTEVMLVEDPVKRVDNMTMAHGLEARTPFLDHELVELAAACPPELKLADGGKGVLKAAARGVVPDAVIDRQKGYFPVPALTHLQGPVLELVSDALRSSSRGLFRREAVDAMLRAPNEDRTNLDGSSLWQLGLLELWLQRHVGC